MASPHAEPYAPDALDAASRLAEAHAAVAALPPRRDQLLPAFQLAQAVLGWLPREAVEHIAAHLRLPLSEVFATATAYSELRLERPPSAAWYVCTGVACDLAGAEALIEAAEGRAVRIDCQFLCALAPVVHDAAERLYGRVNPDGLRAKVAGR